MPQFEFATVFWPQLIWLAGIFALLYFGVVAPTLPKVAKVVGDREAHIASDIAAAEAAKDTADQLASAYQSGIASAQTEARAALASAKADAAKASETALASANAEIEAKIAAAETDLAAAKRAALAEIEAIAADTAGAIVTKLTGTAPPAERVRSVIGAMAVAN